MLVVDVRDYQSTSHDSSRGLKEGLGFCSDIREMWQELETD